MGHNEMTKGARHKVSKRPHCTHGNRISLAPRSSLVQLSDKKLDVSALV